MRGPIEGLKRHAATFIVGMFFAVGAVIFFLQFSGSLPSGDRYTVDAALPTSAALVDGSRVTMAGVQVGTVSRIERRGFATVVSLVLDDERVTPLPEDTRVTLRQRTPVGESYIALTRGTSKQALADGAALPVSQSEEYVDVDEVLSTLQGGTREKVRQLIRGIGEGVRGQGDELNAVVGDGADVLKSGSDVFTLLSHDREQLARTIDRLGRLSAAVGERTEAVRVIARQGLTSLRAVASRDASLRRLVRELPATLDQVRSSSGTLDSVSKTATPVVAELARALGDVRPAVKSLAPAAEEGRRVVRALDTAAVPLQGTLERVTKLSEPLSDALPELTKTMCDIAPMVRYLKPYTDDTLAALVGMGSASNSYDAIGHLIRISPILNENALAGAPKEVTLAAQTLLRSGVFEEMTPLTWDPYPKPDQVGKNAAGKGRTLSGPEALAKSGWKFPRVTSDC